MKIFHAANFSLYPSHYQKTSQLACYYALDRSISYGLAQHSHCVFDFSIEDAFRRYRLPWRSKRTVRYLTNDILSSAVSRFEPDLLLLGHAKYIEAKTLADLRAHSPQMKIAQWWVDPLHPSENAKEIKELRSKLPYLDAFFATTSSMYVREVFHCKENAENIRFIPNICNTSVCAHRAFENRDYAHDALFTGRFDSNRAEMTQHLRKHSVSIFGEPKETLISGANYIDTIGQTKIGININRYIIPLYASDRLIHITGNGALALCAYSPSMEKLFGRDEVIYFETASEFQDRLQYYLSNDEERRTVARKGWERAHDDYNETRVTQFMLDSIFSNVSDSQYHWASY